MDKLGGSNSKKKALDEEEKRSRVNSLRNGETSKVIQTHNIDVPIINKEHCDQYQEFQQQQELQNQPSRKESIEYFKDQSKQLQEKMQRSAQKN